MNRMCQKRRRGMPHLPEDPPVQHGSTPQKIFCGGFKWLKPFSRGTRKVKGFQSLRLISERQTLSEVLQSLPPKAMISHENRRPRILEPVVAEFK